MNYYGDNVRVVADEISLDWVRTIHLMAGQSLDCHWMTQTPQARRASLLKTYPDSVNLHHLVMSYRIREPVKGMNFGGQLADWRRVVIWALDEGDRVSLAAHRAAAGFYNHYQVFPKRILIGHLPKGVDYGQDIECEILPGLSLPLMLLEIDWVVPRFLVVC